MPLRVKFSFSITYDESRKCIPNESEVVEVVEVVEVAEVAEGRGRLLNFIRTVVRVGCVCFNFISWFF
jgi:hypothetical protein